MRILIYFVILVLLFFAPLERVDVAKLLPVEAVCVYTEDGVVVLEIDAKHIGKGVDVHQALRNLVDITPAVVYLDTAKYLLVSEDAIVCVEDLRQYLKLSVKVCVCDAKGSVKDVARYLDVHGNLPRLQDWVYKP